MADSVEHPKHYGGASNPYEAIKVIDAWGLGFSLGNAVKYICRAGKKNDDDIEDLKKAHWYLRHEIEKRLWEREQSRLRAAREQNSDSAIRVSEADAPNPNTDHSHSG